MTVKNKKTQEAPAEETTYRKSDILQSQRYAKHRDALAAILKGNTRYTISEVDTALDKFMKSEVK